MNAQKKNKNASIKLKAGTLWLYPLLAFVLIAGASFYTWIVSSEAVGAATSNQNRHIEQSLASQALTYREIFNEFVNEQTQQHQVIARLPRVQSLFTTLNQSEANNIAAELVELLPNFTDLRIVIDQEISPDNQSTPAFKFTAIDMVRKTLNHETPLTEAVSSNDRWFLTLATPLKNEAGDIVGAIYSAMSLLSIDTIINHLKSQNFSIHVSQQLPNTKLQTLIASQKKVTKGDQKHEVKIPKSYLTLTVSTNSHLLPSANAITDDITTVHFLTALICGLSVITFFILIIRNIVNDQRKIVTYLSSQSDTSTLKFALPFNHKVYRFILTALQTNQPNQQAQQIPLPENALANIASLASSEQESTTHNKSPKEQALSTLSDIDTAKVTPANQASALPHIKQGDVIQFPKEHIGAFAANLDASLLNDTAIATVGYYMGHFLHEHGIETIVFHAYSDEKSKRLGSFLKQGLIKAGVNLVEITEHPVSLMFYAMKQLNMQHALLVSPHKNHAGLIQMDCVLNNTLMDHTLWSQALSPKTEVAVSAGNTRSLSIFESYQQQLLNEIALIKTFRIVIAFPQDFDYHIMFKALFEQLGCDIELFEYDGVLSELTIHNQVSKLIKNHKADIGFIVDEQWLTLKTITNEGQSMSLDQLAILITDDVLTRLPGSNIIIDAFSSQSLSKRISIHSGNAMLCNARLADIRMQMEQHESPLGVAHPNMLIFAERWHGWPDAVYSMTRILEILAFKDETLAQQYKILPQPITSKPYIIGIATNRKASIIKSFQQHKDITGRLIEMDNGLRIEYPNAWGYIKPDASEDSISISFEAQDSEAMLTIQTLFKEVLLSVDHTLTLTF